MSLFSPYRPKNYKFFEPERLTTAEANLRRTQALLAESERAWKASLQLSPVAKKIVEATTSSRLTRDRLASGPKALQIAAALSQFREKDFSDPLLRSAYRELRARQGGQKNVSPPGSSKRYYNPAGKNFAQTVSGATARITGWTNIKAGAASAWKPIFMKPHQVVPCIQRNVRRQVMFAKNFAGVGYRSKKRRTWASEVPC